MATTNDEPGVTANPRSTGRPRRILSGIALVLACILIVVSTVAIWTHQVALNTGRFNNLITGVVGEPAVTDPIAARISTQVVDALGVQARLEARLPDALRPLAGTLTVAIRDRINERLQVALQNPRIQEALVGALSFTHEQVVRLLRGESDVVAIVDGYLTINVFPVVGAALTELQDMGLIPADIQLPDLTAPDAPEVLAERLETTLGVTLPPDFGTIQLMPAQRLDTARTLVRVFDVVVILLVALTLFLVTVALWLARDRRRMLIYLGVGTFIAFLVARLAIRSVEDAILDGIADSDVAGLARAVLDATLADLRGVTVIVLIVAAIVAIAAYVRGRPTWVMKTASSDRRCGRQRPGSRHPRGDPPREPHRDRAVRHRGHRVHRRLAGPRPRDRVARRRAGDRLRGRAARARRRPRAGRRAARCGPGRTRRPAGGELVAAVRP